MVELIVVLMILAILIATSVIGFRGARTSTDATTVKTAAQSYSEVIDAFALDHAGRVPEIGTVDWPSNALDRGPVKPTAVAGGSPAQNTYLGRHVPEAVQGPGVDIVTTVAAGGKPPATGRQGVVRYVLGPKASASTPATSYRIEVWATTRNGTLPKTMTCWLGTLKPDGQVNPCA